MTDHDDIVRELRAIREAINTRPSYGQAGFLIGMLFVAIVLLGSGVEKLNTIPEPPQPTTPETQHGLDNHTPVAVAASRDSSYGPTRRNPVSKTLTKTSERPRPGRDNWAVSEWVSLTLRGSGWGPLRKGKR